MGKLFNASCLRGSIGKKRICRINHTLIGASCSFEPKIAFAFTLGLFQTVFQGSRLCTFSLDSRMSLGLNALNLSLGFCMFISPYSSSDLGKLRLNLLKLGPSLLKLRLSLFQVSLLNAPPAQSLFHLHLALTSYFFRDCKLLAKPLVCGTELLVIAHDNVHVRVDRPGWARA